MAEQENSLRGDTARTLVTTRFMSLVIRAPFFSNSHFVQQLDPCILPGNLKATKLSLKST
jgi:hypothetical protein